MEYQTARRQRFGALLEHLAAGDDLCDPAVF